MYYKLTSTTGKVADVFEKIEYCRWEPQTKCFLLCSEEEKQGVVSQRRDTCYHIIGWPEFGVEAPEGTLEEISLTEYMELKEQLDREDRESEAIEQIKERIGGHDIDIGDLTDAVLELAEIIGG